MMSNGRAVTYADELALVNHLVDELERRLAGRHEARLLRTNPSDHCHLGVLGPRDPNVEDVEAPDFSEGHEDEALRIDRDTLESGHRGSQGQTDDEEDEVVELDAAEAEQRAAERQGAARDSTRRPPSSLGFEIVARPDRGNAEIELTVRVGFSIYTQHFPTFEEERAELGAQEETAESEVAEDRAATSRSRGAGRNRVTLVEAFESRRVEVPPIRVRIAAGGSRRLTDNGVVQQALDAVLDAAMQDPTIWREVGGDTMVPVDALGTTEAFSRFLARLATGAIRRPPLRANLDIRIHPTTGGSMRIRCYLCNNTERDPVQRFRDQYHIFADACVEGIITSGELSPIELLPVPRDYQFDRSVWAIGHGASVVVSEDRHCVRTEALARYYQPRRTTNQEPSARFEDLIQAPIETLEAIRQAMVGYGNDWQTRVIEQNAYHRSQDELEQCRLDLESFRDEEARFAAGIAALVADERLREAFEAMNRVFLRTSRGRFDRWHLFQIVFLVTQLPALAIREGLTEAEWPRGVQRSWHDVLDRADVLWFPTGGGKTEAYLGLISCAVLYDRLRGKEFGITAWLRFPLRMLSVQQLQRAAVVVWETEQERRTLLGEASENSEPISLGYFVGKSSTPNQLGWEDAWSFTRIESDEQLRNKLLLISNCPACGGTNTVCIEPDRSVQRIRHVCSNCNTELPIYVSDDEVYRFLPTVVVGTIDKMASIAYNAKFPLLWGGASWRCPESPEHGFGIGDWCIRSCARNAGRGRRARQRVRVSPYDPSPTLHIQDELHLLQQELGAFAGHYETLVRACESAVGGRPPKTIAATATIEGFEHQIRHIYGVARARRFPTRGYDLLETFYTSVDRDHDDPEQPEKVARLYVAFRPPHLHAADAASLCVRLLHEELIRLFDHPYDAAAWLPNARTEEEVHELLYYYATTLTYVGSKARGVRIRQALDRVAGRLRPGGARDLATEFLSGDSSLAEIAETVRRLEYPPEWTEEGYLDATVATNVISHGVDVERFNVMVMDSIPEETADYIQASSRSGRRHVGLVMTILPSYSLRASSVYHRFKEYHQHLERLVSPVSVNRFAKYAAGRTSPGIMIGLLLGRYGPLAHTDSLRQRNRAAELLNPAVHSNLPFQISSEEFRRAVAEAYALGQGIYPESLESAMREVLDEQVERFLYQVRGSHQRTLVEVVQPKPMSSLRDVDVGVRFRPREDINWQKLPWFDSHMS